MKPERWKKIEKIFHGALECEESERASFLDDRFNASPSLAGGKLFLRGLKNLYCIQAR